MAMQVSLTPEGDLSLSGFDQTSLYLLNDVPAILHYRSDPGVRARMFPDALPGDQEANDAWHNLMDADLEHLFASAANRVRESGPLGFQKPPTGEGQTTGFLDR